MGRRELLLDAVTDHVLANGLIGLSLRPVAAAVGTSDRMLVYYFGSRDELVSAVVNRAGDRSIAVVEGLEGAPSVRVAVNRLWAAYQCEPLMSCMGLYVQAAATGFLGREPYLREARHNNQRWSAALRAYFVRSGAPSSRVDRVIRFVDSALYGFHLDRITDQPAELARGVADLARAAQAIADGAAPFARERH